MTAEPPTEPTRLDDGRALFERIEAWASVLPRDEDVTDPAVSPFDPFDLIREALLHCTLNDYTGPALAALDQLQRDHETLREALAKAQHWHEQQDYDEALNVIDAALASSRDPQEPA